MTGSASGLPLQSAAQALLADRQSLNGPLFSDGAEHVRDQPFKPVDRCPAPVSPRVGVIKPHRPAVRCNMIRTLILLVVSAGWRSGIGCADIVRGPPLSRFPKESPDNNMPIHH